MKRIAKKNRIGLEVGKEYTIYEDPDFSNYYITSGYMFLKENLENYFETEPKQKKDKVVSQVLNKFKERSKIGIKKYGTTLHENELTIPEWINHAIEEQMDNILYLTKLKNELTKNNEK